MTFSLKKILRKFIKYVNKIINICTDAYQFFETALNYHIRFIKYK